MFNFHNQDSSPWPANIPVVAEWWEVPTLSSHLVHQKQGWDQDQRPQESWVTPPQLPLLLLDQRFESDRSSASTSSSVVSVSERLGSSRYPCHGQWPHTETVGHVKINLLAFKDEDTKDAITYWEITVYHHTGCWDHTILPYLIWPLQSYPGELVRSSGTDVPLDDILTLMDENYNNIKVLDTLNQELFQLWMGKNETVFHWGYAFPDTSKS